MKVRSLLILCVLLVSLSLATAQRYESSNYLGKKEQPSNELNQPYGMAVDSRGNLWIANEGGHNLVYYDGTQFKMAAGAVNNPGYTDGQGVSIRFSGPKGIAIGTRDSREILAICDAGNDVVRLLDITNLNAITNVKLLDVGGFNGPSDVEIDGSGNLIVADRMNYVIKKIDAMGNVTILAGQEGTNGTDNGDATTKATFKLPTGIFVNGDDIYVADAGKVRMISGGKVTTLDLSPDYIWGPGQGPIGNATDITMFGKNIMVLADGCTVRRFDVGSDEYQTMAGGNYNNDCGFASNEKDTMNKFRNIFQVMYVEDDKTLYVADHSNHMIRTVKLGTVSSTPKLELNKTVIYPNPATNKVYIQGLGASKGDAINVSIVSITGSIVYTKNHTIQGDQLSVPLTELNQGLYLVQMTVGNEMVTKKLYVK